MGRRRPLRTTRAIPKTKGRRKKGRSPTAPRKAQGNRRPQAPKSPPSPRPTPEEVQGGMGLGGDSGAYMRPKPLQGFGTDALYPKEVFYPGVGPALHDPLGQHGADAGKAHELLEAGLVKANGFWGGRLERSLHPGFHLNQVGPGDYLRPEAKETQKGYREEVAKDHSVKAKPKPPRRTPASAQGSAPGLRATKPTV